MRMSISSQFQVVADRKVWWSRFRESGFRTRSAKWSTKASGAITEFMARCSHMVMLRLVIEEAKWLTW